MAGILGMGAGGGGLLGGLGGLDGISQRVGGFVDKNPMALMAASSALLDGQGWGGGMRGFMQGGMMDTQNRRQDTQDKMQQQLFQQKQTLFDQEQQDRQAQMATANRTQQWFRQNMPDYADAPAEIRNEVIKSLFSKQPTQTKDIQEYEYAKQQGFKGTFPDWLKSGAGSSSFSKTPVYGRDKDGNIVIGQLNDAGQFQQTQLPEGFTPLPGADRVDLGTGIGIIDRGGRLQNVIPKDIAGAEEQKAVGKATGEKLADRDNALAKADQMLSVIDGAINHPGREGATGGSRMFNAPFGFTRPGSQTADYEAYARQLEGKAFLQAFESLKGGGQITENEGAKATAAIARLSLTQSDKAYLEALMELREVVEDAAARLRGSMSTSSGQPSKAGGFRILGVE